MIHFVQGSNNKGVSVLQFSSDASCGNSRAEVELYQDWAYLADIETPVASRQMGFGTKMLEKIFEVLKSRGCRNLYVDPSAYGSMDADRQPTPAVVGATDRLIGWYLRHGFVEVNDHASDHGRLRRTL